ncbi:uncharacterized protein K489DRAFT_322426, partial [Dissoconium aciculare CBS 342.82]|uniref:GCS light chain n=1 Tax=Dissoconium aciculare CBS 342.82 TaxID=1314786 RepID=A0A6J3M2N2_9PEZI
NIMGGGSTIHRSSTTKSNAELISSLRTNLLHHAGLDQDRSSGAIETSRPSYQTWTRKQNDILEIPGLDHAETRLEDERSQYDITVKLFFLPGTSGPNRSAQLREAVTLVLEALAMPSIDLLILSFPGIYFDEQEDCPDKLSTRGPIETEPEPLEEQLPIWKTLEALHIEGTVARLGIAEFGKERLQSLLAQASIKPSVDQINLRDCCSVPQDLLTLAKSTNVELLVHNDSSNILPRGITRELLGDGPSGAGVLCDAKNGTGDGLLNGELKPQWVVKYTAVVKDRGVVESKGYFAVANLDQE